MLSELKDVQVSKKVIGSIIEGAKLIKDNAHQLKENCVELRKTVDNIEKFFNC